MLIELASIKGAPGVTSTALVLAAVWPRPVVLVEADPTGGDLTYRCRMAPAPNPESRHGLVALVAAVRATRPQPAPTWPATEPPSSAASPAAAGGPMDEVLWRATEELACGVRAVLGVRSAAQARGLAGTWPTLARALSLAEVDVILDLGRLDPNGPLVSVAAAADELLIVASATLDSVMHLRTALPDIQSALPKPTAAGAAAERVVTPVLVGPDSHADRDCADLDAVLTRDGLGARQAMPLPFDPRALHRLETGEVPTGRLGRTLLLRAAKTIATALVQAAPDGTTRIATPAPPPASRASLPVSAEEDDGRTRPRPRLPQIEWPVSP
jgi:hypothetical protein